MIKKYNSQLLMEICNEFFNYRIIIKKNSLFNDYEINSQKYQQTEGNKVISIFELHKYNLLDVNTNMRLIKIVSI
tara:strand:- start:264 stop:488 length:225 start_codon:yes stop_codon:yes gene_type:complete